MVLKTSGEKPPSRCPTLDEGFDISEEETWVLKQPRALSNRVPP
jgi:hypothetical protein